MPDLTFVVEAAEAVQFSAVPQIGFKLRVTNRDPEEDIQSVILRAQIQIDVTRRRYSQEEQEKLRDLFGDADRWSQTLRPLLWGHANVSVPAFRGTATVDLPVPCSFDFNVGATKYFHGLGEGEVPLTFLFSGTVFFSGAEGNMQVAPIPWDRESHFRLPVHVWRQLMDSYYPGVAWLCLQRDTFDRLYRYKVRHGIPTWEETIENMLALDEAVTR